MTENSLDLSKMGQRIRDQRQSIGLSQKEFANKVKLTQSAISQIEEGKRMPSVKALHKIALGLNCSVDWLMGGHSTTEGRDPESNEELQQLYENIKQKRFGKNKIMALNRFINDFELDGE